MFRLATLFAVILTAVSTLAQSTTTLSYDTHYDDGTLSLNDVACSNGAHGLESSGYTTLGSLPAFPHIGGVDTIPGWDSPNCGACYAVTYGTNTIYILAVDASRVGFTVSEEAMNDLTNGLAEELGRVDVTSTPAPPSACNMTSAK